MGKKTNNNYQLILHNDENHSFKDVIISLIEICEHSDIQAEQCAIIVDLKGSCCVNINKYSKIIKQKEKLTGKNFKVSIKEI